MLARTAAILTTANTTIANKQQSQNQPSQQAAVSAYVHGIVSRLRPILGQGEQLPPRVVLGALIIAPLLETPLLLDKLHDRTL